MKQNKFLRKKLKEMDRFNVKNYDTDVKFVSVIEAQGLEYPEVPQGDRKNTGVEAYTRADLMCPETPMVVPTMFMGVVPVQTETPEEENGDEEGEPLWGGDVILKKNLSLDAPVVLENGEVCNVNLNNKTVTAAVFVDETDNSNNSYVFWVKNGAELTIDGEGKVEAQEAEYSMAVWAQGGKVTINGGEYYNGGDGCDLIYASAGGQVEVNGGYFHATEYKGIEAGTTNPHSALNIKNGDRDFSDIVVYGGKFYGFDPANNLSEPNPSAEWLEKHPNGFVAKGYKSVEVEPNVWEVMPE